VFPNQKFGMIWTAERMKSRVQRDQILPTTKKRIKVKVEARNNL
jgi:hypothetical protein